MHKCTCSFSYLALLRKRYLNDTSFMMLIYLIIFQELDLFNNLCMLQSVYQMHYGQKQYVYYCMIRIVRRRSYIFPFEMMQYNQQRFGQNFIIFRTSMQPNLEVKLLNAFQTKSGYSKIFFFSKIWEKNVKLRRVRKFR